MTPPTRHRLVLSLLVGVTTACSSPKPPDTSPEPEQPAEEEAATPVAPRSPVQDLPPLEEARTACTHDRMWSTLIDTIESLRTDYTELEEAKLDNIDYNRWATLMHATRIDSETRPNPCPPRKRCMVFKTLVYEQPDGVLIYAATRQAHETRPRVWEVFEGDASAHPLGPVMVDVHVSGGADSRADAIEQEFIARIERAHNAIPQCHDVSLTGKGEVVTEEEQEATP